jgi:hypothetical protein
MVNFYKFSQLEETVKKLFGIDEILVGEAPKQKTVVVRLQSGDINKIKFRDGGIVLEQDGVVHQGYLVKEENYRQVFYDRVLKRKSNLPKFHTTSCETLDKMKSSNRFDGVYIFSNSVIKRNDDAFEYKNETDLRLCNYCLNQDDRISEIMFTTDFVNEILSKYAPKDGFRLGELPREFEKDPWGYIHGWDEISLSYRMEKNFTCESCHLDLSRHKYFLEVHHINSNKTDNRRSNLKCLCVACHANVDDYHRENYYKNSANLEKLNQFKRLFGSQIALS